jgi:hypothetical protein
VATVEGQANVVKGDSLFLMDDSNSYWWLVRVLKTQEVGYIPAENIETPYERLARLNKHRNVDVSRSITFPNILAYPTSLQACGCYSRRARFGSISLSCSPSPTATTTKSVPTSYLQSALHLLPQCLHVPLSTCNLE